MVHDFSMDMEVSPNPDQHNHNYDELKIDRFSALLALATDSNYSVSKGAIDELCRLNAAEIEFLATDLLSLTANQIPQLSREQIFKALLSCHQKLPPLPTALLLELLGDTRQQNSALECFSSLYHSSTDVLPVLIHKAKMLSHSDPERSTRCIECARIVSEYTDQFISQFAPELPHSVQPSIQLPLELVICGRLLFTNDHDVFSEPMCEWLENLSLNLNTCAPTSLFMLLGGDLQRMPIQTQMAALRLASLAPSVTSFFGERISRAIRGNSPAIVRQCGLYLLMKIAPSSFEEFIEDFEALLLSDSHYATECAALTAYSVSHVLSSERQIFLVDSILRAAKESSIERYQNLLFCLQSFDAEHTLSHLFKLYINAPSTGHENITRSTLENVMVLIPNSRRAAVLARVRNELRVEFPSFQNIINTILG